MYLGRRDHGIHPTRLAALIAGQAYLATSDGATYDRGLGARPFHPAAAELSTDQETKGNTATAGWLPHVRENQEPGSLLNASGTH